MWNPKSRPAHSERYMEQVESELVTEDLRHVRNHSHLGIRKLIVLHIQGITLMNVGESVKWKLLASHATCHFIPFHQVVTNPVHWPVKSQDAFDRSSSFGSSTWCSWWSETQECGLLLMFSILLRASRNPYLYFVSDVRCKTTPLSPDLAISF